MFKKLEGETAVLHSKGVYRVADLYERDGKLFAGLTSTTFVRLYANGSTSKPATQIETLQLDGPLYKDRFGRLTTTGGDGRKPLIESESETLLLGKD